jgi:hypothetical protein
MSGGQHTARGWAGQPFNGGLGSPDWLAATLRDVTGIDAVVPEMRPDTDAAVMVQIDKAIGSQSTQRLSLQWHPEGIVLATFPAELKKQAEATYRTTRAERILDFAAVAPAAWQLLPIVHLAYRFAAVPERIYLTCGLGLNEYVRRWEGQDFGYVGGHHYDQVRPVLWPWLLERGYASRKDESQLPGFLDRLGRRDAHLRPGIRIQRIWSRPEAASLDQRRALVGELRAATTELLKVLDEPLPPACAGARRSEHE